MKSRAPWLFAFAAAVAWLAAMAVYLAQQEVPTGWLRGKAVAEETGQPLPSVVIQLDRVGAATEVGAGELVVRTRADGTFGSGRIPAGLYRLQATSRAHRLRAADVLIEESKVHRVNLELSPVPPFFDLRVPQHVFTPDETPQVNGQGFVPGETVDFTLYRVDTGALLAGGGGNLRALLYTSAGGAGFEPALLDLEGNPALTVSGRLSADISRRDVEGVFRQRFDLPVRQPGIYVVAAKADSIQRLAWVMVTRLGLITKQWGDQALAYVVDLRTGAPVSGAKVWFAVEGGPSTLRLAQGRPEQRRGATSSGPPQRAGGPSRAESRGGEAVSGVTDAEGLFQAAVAGKREYYSLLARAEHQGSEAFLTTWVWRGERESEERIYAYTDRPVYRPGNEVHFKGVARRFAGVGYSVPADQPVEVEVRDPRDTLVYKARLVTDGFGSYHGSLRLNDEAPTGYYRLVTTMAGKPHQASFDVAEYRKPEYSVEVTTGKKRYTRGEGIRAQVSAQYYFGAPVAGAEVQYTVYRSPYWFYPEEGGANEYESEGEYYEGEGYDYGEVVEEGTAETGADGIARFSIPTRRPFGKSAAQAEVSVTREEEASDYRYTIQAAVTDPSRKEVSVEGSTLVTQGEFMLLLSPARWVASPGEAADIEIQARDYDRHPVRGVRVEVSAGPETWRAREVSVGPGPHAAVTTDAAGKARFRFTPQTPGYYRIAGRARDRRGNRIRGAAYLWVTSEDYADLRVPYPELEIVADKRLYHPGEQAVLLINTRAQGATALVTVEGPRLYSRRLIVLKANSTRIELPITEEYAPNFFISAAFVRNKQFAQEQKRIKVSVAARQLKLDVKPDKRRYAPGERATYLVRTTDWRGNPVSAELSVGVVDEAIYAIEEDSAPPMRSFFYPARTNRVSTAYSFPQLYLDAEKGAAGIQVRKRFPDTAYWNPTVVTDGEGRASVSFAMPDSLTTWRATVRGATLQTAVGEATAKVQTFKDLLVRLEAPRFFVQRDRLTLSALVHNYTRSRQDLQVWLTAPGLRPVRRLRLVGGEAGPRRLTLAPDEVRRQDWEIEVPAPGSKEITVYAKARSGLSDAMALTLPALPHGRERVEWRSGAVQARAVERLSVRRDAVPQAGDLRVRFAPSIASVMLGALDYLALYPYGCTEQTMSAFLPDVVVARALRELELANPGLEKQLPDMVQTGLDRLYGFQHNDGGWGWWRYDQSDPWMTAYVVFGLITAQRNGFTINQNALNAGLAWLDGRARSQMHALTGDRLYLLYVLSLAGRDGLVEAPVTEFYRALHSLDSYSLALLASTLLEQGRTAEAKVVAERLWGRAQQTQALVWWQGRPGWGRGGDTETTGLALKALLALDPNDPRIYRIVRWLVLNREGNAWVSTRDTAFVLFGLTDFLKISRELQPDYQAVVTLNGKPLLRRRFTREDLFAPEVEVRASGAALPRGENLLRFEKEGAGNLYYTLVLRQFVGRGDLPEVITAAGISVERLYYRMISERDPRTGVITTAPGPRPVTDFRSGESILVRLKITSEKRCDYIIVEDPLPAGCEVSERGDVEPWEWDRWWSDLEVRDEKVAIFARELPAGASVIEYHLRPQIPGDYHVMPTEVYSMYNPDVRGSGAEARVRLR